MVSEQAQQANAADVPATRHYAAPPQSFVAGPRLIAALGNTMSIGARLKRWYEGRYIPPDNPPASAIVFLLGHYERHWTSRAVHGLISFYLKEWKWIWGATISIIGLVVAIAKIS